MAAKEIEVSTQPNIKVNLENHEATHYTCTEEKKNNKKGNGRPRQRRVLV